MKQDKIRVVQILEATSGGTRKHIMDIALKLNPARFELTLICSTLRDPRFHEDIERLLENNVTVKVIQMKRAIRPLADLTAFLGIYRYLRHHSFDILHAHSSKAGFLGRLAGRLAGVKSIIYSPHCYYFQQKKGLARFFFLLLEQFAAIFTDKIVAVSESERNITIKENIAGPRKVEAIINAIDLSDFEIQPTAEETKKRLGIDPASPVVGTIGRFTAQKGYEYFFRAASQILERNPDVMFLVLGSEHNKITAERLINRLGISKRVMLFGYSKNVHELLAAMDVFVLSSLWEGLPYALLEAMAMKKPVVATRISGVAEVVKHAESGYLVEPKNPDALARSILELLGEPEKAETMGEKGRGIIEENHRIETQIQGLSNLYEHLMLAKERKNPTNEANP